MARKIGVKSDTDLDRLLKKVVAEAKTAQISSAPQASTSSSSKDVASAPIVEDAAAENEKKDAAYKEEEAAAAKKVTPAEKGKETVLWMRQRLQRRPRMSTGSKPILTSKMHLPPLAKSHSPLRWEGLTSWLPSLMTPIRKCQMQHRQRSFTPALKARGRGGPHHKELQRSVPSR